MNAHDETSTPREPSLPPSSRPSHGRKRPKPDSERIDFETWFRKARAFEVHVMFEEVRSEDLAEPRHLLTLGKKQLDLLLTAWAIDTLRLYCEVCPNDKKGAALLAEALAKDPMTGSPEAYEALRHALKLDAKNAKCHAELAYIFQERDQLEESLASYRRAFELGLDQEDAWFRAANVCLRLDRPREAQELLHGFESKIEDRQLLVEMLAECRRQLDRAK